MRKSSRSGRSAGGTWPAANTQRGAPLAGFSDVVDQRAAEAPVISQVVQGVLASHGLSTLVLDVEPGFPQATLDELAKRGHAVKVAGEKSITFGRAQCIQRVEHGYIAASDSRGDAQAVVA